MADEGETNNVAKQPQYSSIVAIMQAKLATFRTPYIPQKLTENNLACYNCSVNSAKLWGNFTGPGCIQK